MIYKVSSFHSLLKQTSFTLYCTSFIGIAVEFAGIVVVVVVVAAAVAAIAVDDAA